MTGLLVFLAVGWTAVAAVSLRERRAMRGHSELDRLRRAARRHAADDGPWWAS